MNPQDRRAQLEARTAAMRQQVDSLLEGLGRQSAALQQAQAQAAEVTGRAVSPDGLVTVVVNAVGVVTDVQFAASVFTRSTPEKLAHSIVEMTQQAAADARQQVDAALAPVRANTPDLPDVFPGAPAIKDLLGSAQATTGRRPRHALPDEDEDEDFSNSTVLWGGNR
ncbi:MAG: YbaB/EbfC family nucleoid-associated protein [Pseudonocardiaceae bacterium]